MTGIGAPYEAPSSPEIVLAAEGCSVDQSAEKLLAYLRDGHYLQPLKPVDESTGPASAEEC